MHTNYIHDIISIPISPQIDEAGLPCIINSFFFSVKMYEKVGESIPLLAPACSLAGVDSTASIGNSSTLNFDDLYQKMLPPNFKAHVG